MSAILLSAVPRNVVAEETVTITLSATPLAYLDAALADKALLIRARVQGGPIRVRFLTPPTTTDGTPLYDSDVVEWSNTEFLKLISTSTGGIIIGAGASADALLFVTYYA